MVNASKEEVDVGIIVCRFYILESGKFQPQLQFEEQL